MQSLHSMCLDTEEGGLDTVNLMLTICNYLTCCVVSCLSDILTLDHMTYIALAPPSKPIPTHTITIIRVYVHCVDRV